MSEDIGIDLGTATVIIYINGKGIVLKEPSVIAIEKKTNKVLAVGDKAKRMLGRAPKDIEIIEPLSEGVISNFTATTRMLKQFMKKVNTSKFGSTRIMICVPSQTTEVEKRAVLDTAVQLERAKKVYLIEEPVAAAIGAGIDISKPCGNLVIDIGGGTTDIAVISISGAVVSTSTRTAGNQFDEAIMKYVKKRYNLLIGKLTAEILKEKIGTVYPMEEELTEPVRGKNISTGLPMEVNITSKELLQVLFPEALKIVDAVKSTMEKAPPELIEDISERGIYVTGGGSQIKGMAKLIEDSTGIKTILADEPASCVAIGTGKALDNLNLLSSKARR